MDRINEKKWFVYLGDHHEGPFSVQEIHNKMAEGRVSTRNYVWAEGMPDWKPMPDVGDFQEILVPSNVVANAAANGMTNGGASAGANGSELKVSPTPTATSDSGHVAIHAQPNDTVAKIVTEPAVQITPVISPRNEVAPEPAVEKKRAPKKLLLWGMMTLVPACLVFAYLGGSLNPLLESPAVRAGSQTLTDWSRPYLLKLADMLPMLSDWVSPIPNLEDVSEEDYKELKAAAMAKLEKGGPKIAAALSIADVFTPTFYVSTNLPEGSRFDVFVEGVPDTLLNHTSFSARVGAVAVKGLGKTEPVRFTDGKPLPRGEYAVYVLEAEEQPGTVQELLAPLQPAASKLPPHLPKGRKVISRKIYFLGGKNDAIYLSRLKEYHDKLSVKASAELGEVKQFSMTLSSQLDASLTAFSRLRSKPRAKQSQRKAWQAEHSKWTQLNSQLNDSFGKWTPEALQNEYFYGSLFALTQEAGQAVARVHLAHHAFFTENVDSKSYEIQLGEAVSQAQSILSTLKAKIEQAEAMQPTPNGMPRREGL